MNDFIQMYIQQIGLAFVVLVLPLGILVSFANFDSDSGVDSDLVEIIAFILFVSAIPVFGYAAIILACFIYCSILFLLALAIPATIFFILFILPIVYGLYLKIPKPRENFFKFLFLEFKG